MRDGSSRCRWRCSPFRSCCSRRAARRSRSTPTTRSRTGRSRRSSSTSTAASRTRRSLRRCTASTRSACPRSRHSCCTRSAARTCACCTCCSSCSSAGSRWLLGTCCVRTSRHGRSSRGSASSLWMPAARDQALTALADLPLACLFVSAALLFGGGEVALGSVFAAAALGTKRDALAFVAVLYAVSFAVVLVRRERDRLAPLGISAFCVVLSAIAVALVRRAPRPARPRRVAVARALDELGFVLHRIAHVAFASRISGRCRSRRARRW